MGIEIKTVSIVTSCTFALTLLYFLHVACSTDEFECSTAKFPTVSDLVGKHGRDKIYTIIMTFYNCAVN